jgi:hypothetical protein
LPPILDRLRRSPSAIEIKSPANGNDWSSFFWSLGRDIDEEDESRYLQRHPQDALRLHGKTMQMRAYLRRHPRAWFSRSWVRSYEARLATVHIEQLLAGVDWSTKVEWSMRPAYWIAVANKIDECFAEVGGTEDCSLHS